MSLIANGAGESAGFYNGVATQSLRFDDGSSAHLVRTPSGASNQKTWTWSAWVKIGTISTNKSLFAARTDSAGTYFNIVLSSLNDLRMESNVETTYPLFKTNALFRDVSAWYNFVVSVDMTQSTASNRIKLYVNGVVQTTASYNPPSQNTDLNVNSTAAHYIGRQAGASYNDGYMAEVNFIDGTALAPTSFGETKNGVWIPIDTSGLTFGTNGFRLDFADNAVDAPESEGTVDTDNIGSDSSGEHNNWTSSGIVAADCAMPDSPENNFATLNPLYFLTASTHLSEGNLQLTHEATAHRAHAGTMFSKTGKWYFEVRNKSDTASASVAFGVGLQDITKNLVYSSGNYNYIYYSNNNNPLITVNATEESSLGGFVVGAGDIMQVAYDADSGKLFIGKNNTYVAADAGTDGNPATGANPSSTLSTTIDYIPFVGTYNNEATANFGQDDTFAGAISSAGNTDGNGIGVFKYAPPSGFLALCTANLPEPTIGPNSATQSDDHFNTVLYTSDDIGAGGTQNVTGVGFKPDWVWLKNRTSASTSHTLYDSNRGTGKHNSPDANVGEVGANSEYGYLGTFGNDGYTLRGGSTNANYVNQSTDAYVSWNWKANGGTTSTLTDGDIDTVVQANTTAGFSIMTFVSNQQQAQELAHGLGAVPAWFILKSRDEDNAFYHYHKGISETKTIFWGSGSLGTGAAETSSGAWDNTVPTSTVVTAGIGGMSFDNTHNIVGYAFAEVDGFSKFDKYTGNNAADGPFVYLGFRPALIITKNFSSAGGSWGMYDNKRNSTNDAGTFMLRANKNEADYFHATYTPIDFLSNGFKIRNTGGEDNSAQSFMYMAFAEAPFKYANAR